MENINRKIIARLLINAPLNRVWWAWTTREGIRSFFAPECNVELKVDGAYEIYFDPSADTGNKGSEGMRILAIQPYKMFSFTWNAPPSIPEIREQRTHVCVRLIEINQNQTELSLENDGYGYGETWDIAFEYFSIAWKDIVLPRLKYSLEVGAIDWHNPPKLKST